MPMGDQDQGNLLQIIQRVFESQWAALGVAAISRYLMRYDLSVRDVLETLSAGIIIAWWVAPGVAEWMELKPRAAAGLGAVLMLVARPMAHGLIRFAQSIRDNPDRILPRRKD